MHFSRNAEGFSKISSLLSVEFEELAGSSSSIFLTTPEDSSCFAAIDGLLNITWNRHTIINVAVI